MGTTARDEQPHGAAPVEEWCFSCWRDDGALGLVAGWRVFATSGRGWYWWALARAGRPLLHVAEWDVVLRADRLLVKAPQLWAELVCDAPFEQWTVGNETYAAALDDPADALARVYGSPTAIASDLEWYATGEVEPFGPGTGYRQLGTVHGVVEIAGEEAVELVEVPASRSHRWGPTLTPEPLEPAVAHLGVRAVFAFPDGTIDDRVLTPRGWCRRA